MKQNETSSQYMSRFFALTVPAIASVRTAAHTPAILGRDGARTRPS